MALVEVASGALVNVLANTIENVVGVATAKWLFSDVACGRSFWYCIFGYLARLFVWESVWRPSSWIWFVSFLGMRRLCVVATQAFDKRPFEHGPELETYWGLASFPTFLIPYKFARAWFRIRPALGWRYFKLHWRKLRQCPRALHLQSLSRSLAADVCGNL